MICFPPITLILAFSFLQISQAYTNNGYQIQDLSDDTLTQDVNLWSFTGATTSSPIETCGSDKMVGGRYMPKNSQATRTYDGLKPFKVIYFQFELWFLDSIDNPDKFIVTVNGQQFTLTNLNHYTGHNNSQRCGIHWSESVMVILIKVIAEDTKVTVTFDLKQNAAYTDESYGFRRIIATLKDTLNGETQGVYQTGNPRFTGAAQIPCPDGQYQDGTCKPCHSDCNQCVGAGNTGNCISCKDGLWFWKGICTQECTDYIYWDDSTCKSTCDAPLKAIQKGGYKFCLFQCQDNPIHFAYPDGTTCDPQCHELIERTNNPEGAYCNFPCTSSAPFLYPDKKCHINCPTPLQAIGPANNQVCQSPCNSAHPFLYSNNSCLLSCNSTIFDSSSINGIDRCNFKCPEGTYLNDDKSRCLTECLPPFYKIVKQGIEAYCTDNCKFPNQRRGDRCGCAKGYERKNQSELTCTLIEYTPALQTIQGTATTLLAATGPSMMLGADPAFAWALMNLMQQFFYLLFLNVNYPSNFHNFLKIFALGNLDFLPNPLSFLVDKDTELDSPENFMDNDFSGNFMLTANGMIAVWSYALLIYLPFKVMYKLLKQPQSYVKKVSAYIVSIFEWSGFISIWLGTFMELQFAALLQVSHLNFTSFKLAFSSLLGIFVFILNIFQPTILGLLIKKHIREDSLTRKKFNSLVDDYDVSFKSKKYFLVYVMVRRQLEVLSITLFYYFPILQTLGPWILNLALVVLLILYRPHHKVKSNFLDIILEVGLFGVHSIIMSLAVLDAHESTNISEGDKTLIGNMLISLCSIVFFAEFSAIVVEQYSTYKTIIKKFIAKKQKSYQQKQMLFKSQKMVNNSIKKNSKGKRSFIRSQKSRKSYSLKKKKRSQRLQSIKDSLPSINQQQTIGITQLCDTKMLEIMEEIEPKLPSEIQLSSKDNIMTPDQCQSIVLPIIDLNQTIQAQQQSPSSSNSSNSNEVIDSNQLVKKKNRFVNRKNGKSKSPINALEE